MDDLVVEVYTDFSAIETYWTELRHQSKTSPYQSFELARLWMETVGAAQKFVAMLIVIFDSDRKPLSLLPFYISTGIFGRKAAYIGDKDFNVHMPLVAENLQLDRRQWLSLLRRGAALSTPQPDFFHLTNQPVAWQGFSHPFVPLATIPSPDDLAIITLRNDQDTIKQLLSKSAFKNMMRKQRHLEAQGMVEKLTSDDQNLTPAILAAFFQQRSERFTAQGIANPFAIAAKQDFIRQASCATTAEQRPLLRWFALKFEQEIIATYGGFYHDGHFAAMINSFDSTHSMAIHSPGDLLLKKIIEDCGKEDIRFIDLGIGKARYKQQWHSRPIQLFDTFVPITLVGRLSTTMLLLMTVTKGRIKRSPKLFAWIKKLRRTFHHFKRR